MTKRKILATLPESEINRAWHRFMDALATDCVWAHELIEASGLSLSAAHDAFFAALRSEYLLDDARMVLPVRMGGQSVTNVRS